MRTKYNIDWKYVIDDDVEMCKNNFDDSEWKTVDLPHDWSIEGPFKQEYSSGTGYLQGGTGWYRKTFELPSSLKDKKVQIQFDGVYKNSEVWINEHYLGKRPYGYSSFHYELTPYLRYGESESNVIAVRVDHPDIADSRWYPGTGIYRNVFLHISDHIHIKPNGIFVSTPVITKLEAQIHVESTLVNDYSNPVQINLMHIITNDQGQVIAKKQSTITVAENSEQTYSQDVIIDNPILWSVDLPYLYHVEVQVIRDDDVADEEQVPLGIRYFSFDPDNGFFLNGTNLKMKGICIHHDAGCLGAAVPVKVWERRLTIIKEAGVNAIRMSHNPPAPELLDLCDSMGFLVMDEAFDEWEYPKDKWVKGHNKGEPSLDGYATYFNEWADIDLRDMILRDRNHPSIVLWSIGNEIDYPNDPYSHPVLEGKYDSNRPNGERMGDIAARLVKVVKQYDKTRPVTAALASPLMSNESKFPESLDVVGYNYMEHLYEGDHLKYPKRIIYGSENGRSQQAWTAVENNEYISAQFIWTGIDYLGEARGWPIRNSTAGMMDLAGFKKPLFYFKQSVWSEKDMVHLGVYMGNNQIGFTRWDNEVICQWKGTEGELVKVVCCTNCPEVELLLNGKSLGVKKLSDFEDRTLCWDVPYQEGILKAVGLRDGNACAEHKLITAGLPDQIKTNTDSLTLKADREDVAHIEVSVIDAKGNLVYDANNVVICESSGFGEIIGLESGDPASIEDSKSLKKKTFHGKLLIYVKASDQAGTLNIRISSPGLETVNVVFDVVG